MPLTPASRVLVTGATGFLGSHLLDRLGQENIELHAVNRSGTGGRSSAVTWHAADLLEPRAATQLIAKARPTHLLHNAWMAIPGKFWTDQSNLQWLETGRALLRAFRENGGERFVGIGTCAEYEWSGDVYSEDRTPIRPAALYGQCKAAMWAEAQKLSDGAFGAAWLRVFLPYGPGDSDKRLVPSVIAALRRGEKIDLGSGSQIRDFIWAPDIADLAATLLASNKVGAFNAGTGQGTSVRKVTEYLAARVGTPGLLNFGARADPVTEPASLVADMSKVSRELSWVPKTDVFNGLDVILETV